MDHFKDIIVFTDGACSGNPGPGGWGTIVVWPKGEVLELGGRHNETTNNRMELLAIIKALDAIGPDKTPLHIYTDSTYAIRGITQWIFGWMKRGWKNAEGEDIKSKDLWQWFYDLVKRYPGKIHWHYVRGHAGIPGNERVDEIAVTYSKGRRAHLYEGNLLQYDVAIHDIPENTELPAMREKGKAKAKAFSYLSLVNGEVQRHQTWKECEARVKGRSGAKFKKAKSAADEKTILADWDASL